MRYFIIILLLFTLFFGTALAGDGSYQKVSDYAKHISKDAQKKITEKAEQAAEEIKGEIKERIKNKIIELLNPLKIKIQQGSAFIREWVARIKNYL